MPRANSGSESGNANRPLHTLRHRSIKAVIWRNETEKGIMFNITLIRSYRQKQTDDGARRIASATTIL